MKRKIKREGFSFQAWVRANEENLKVLHSDPVKWEAAKSICRIGK